MIVLICFSLVVSSCVALAYFKVSLLLSTILTGLGLALLTNTFDGLAVSLLFVICWVLWACLGSLNFASVRNEHLFEFANRLYNKKIQNLSHYENAAITFSAQALPQHPYKGEALHEEEAEKVKPVLMHLQFVSHNVARAFYLNLRSCISFRLSKDDAYYWNQRLMAMISSYHTIVEYVLVMSRSESSRKDSFNNRIENVILCTQLIICLVKQRQESDEPNEHSVLISYALGEGFSMVYKNFRELLRNSSDSFWKYLVSLIIFPLCQWAQAPLDKLRISALAEMHDKGLQTSVFPDGYSDDVVFNDQSLRQFLFMLLDPSSQTVFKSFEQDFRSAINNSQPAD